MLIRAGSLLLFALLAASCVGSKRSSRASGGPPASASPTASEMALASTTVDGGACGDAKASSDPRNCRVDRRWIWGVTIDDPYSLGPTVDALAALPARATARVVFDEDVHAETYRELVPAIHEVADVMGELLDSQFVAKVSVAAHRERAREYLDALNGSVDIWEVGNEVNGEWLGKSADVVAKIAGAYDEVKARRRPAALTLYYNEGCWTNPENEMFAWTEANIPAAMRDGLDYLFVSYYEDDCNGLVPDWNAVFARLAKIFPHAALGFGECGTTRSSAKAAVLTRYYATRVTEPRFVGGFFWWYFSTDMVPKTKPLWTTLASAMAAPP